MLSLIDYSTETIISEENIHVALPISVRKLTIFRVGFCYIGQVKEKGATNLTPSSFINVSRIDHTLH